MANLDTILGFDNLTGIINSVIGDVPQVLPVGFFTESKRIEGNMASYMRMESTRQDSIFYQIIFLCSHTFIIIFGRT